MTDDTTTSATVSTAEPDDDEAEVAAIATVAGALKALSPETRRRVVDWAAAKYGASVAGMRPVLVPEGPRTDGRAVGVAASVNVDPEGYGDFGAMFDAAQPATDLERAITACYWVQVRAGKNPFLSQDANTLLKNLGHQIRDITVPFGEMRARKPALVIQLKKDGSHQQSRKLYRLTPAGVKLVTEALRSGGFSSDAP